MIIIGKYIYGWELTGEYILKGKVKEGADGPYIVWFS